MYLYGAGGHARVIIDIIQSSSQYKIHGIYDDFSLVKEIHSIPIINKIAQSEINDTLIISIGDNHIRKKIVNTLNTNYTKAIHKRAVISDLDVEIKQGTVVMANAVINPNTIVGEHCIINTASVVEHDCKIGDFVHISPNASIAGGVTIGEGTQIGLGANIIPGITIGKWCIVGAGSTVLEDIPDFSVVVGSPATFIKKSTLV